MIGLWYAAQMLARRSAVEAWQPRFTPVNATGGPIQPALLQAVRRAANEGGSVMITVRNSSAGWRDSPFEQGGGAGRDTALCSFSRTMRDKPAHIVSYQSPLQQ